jgi:hypothetical protein
VLQFASLDNKPGALGFSIHTLPTTAIIQGTSEWVPVIVHSGKRVHSSWSSYVNEEKGGDDSVIVERIVTGPNWFTCLVFIG